MNTKQLRQKILDLAIRGKLVPQDPNDEPASVLLERIKAEKEQLIKEGKIKRGKKSSSASDKPHYPFEIPSNWIWATLGEISNYGICSNVAVENIPDDAWVLELEDLEKDTARIIQRLQKSDRDIKGVRHSFERGNILYSKLRTYLNKVLVADKSGFCTTEIIPFILYGGINADYVNMVLRSKYFVDYTIQCGYGVKMPRLSTLDAHNGMIPIPPIQEQNRIMADVEKLMLAVDTIEQEQCDLLDYTKKTKNRVLELAISGKLVPQNPDDEPASILLQKVNPNASVSTDKSHYIIPSSWVWVKLEDIFEINPKNHNNDDDECGFVRMANVQDGYSGKHTFEVRKWREVKKGYCHFQNGDIAVAKISPCFENLKSVIMRSLPNNIGAGTTELVILRSKEVFAPYFLYLFKSPWYISKGTVYFKGVVGQQRVSRDIFTKLAVPMPPLNEQKRIVAKVDELFALIDTIQQSLE